MGHDVFISGSHNDMKLSTLGKDNDKSTRNVYMCSCTRENGWWYNNCACGSINVNTQLPILAWTAILIYSLQN